VNTLTNTPIDVTVIEAEARKSFSFGIWIVDSNKAPVDLTDSSTTFTVAKFDKFGLPTVLISKIAPIQAPTLGYMVVPIQADEMDLKPGTYNFTTTLRIQGYSVVLMKGEFKVLQNTEFESVNEDYVVNNPSQNLQVVLRNQLQVHIELTSMLPPNLIIPSDASDAAVAGYFNNPASLTRGVTDALYATIVYVDQVTSDLQGQIDTQMTWLEGHDNAISQLQSDSLFRQDFDLKGDILVGQTDNQYDTLHAGPNNRFLIADSTQPLGLRWTPGSHLTGGSISQGGGTARYVRVAVLDGANVNSGAALELEYGAGANYGTMALLTGRIHFQQRGDNGVSCTILNDVPAHGGGEFPLFYTRQTSTYVFELWALLSTFSMTMTVRQLNAFPLEDTRARVTMDSAQTAAPSSLVRVWPTPLEARGSTAQRDQTYGVPANATEQAALANKTPTWWNTDKAWLEGYYAPTGLAGLTALGLLAGRPAGWYPISGKLPRVKIQVPAISGIGANQYRFRTGYWNNPPADQIDGITVDNTNGLLTLPQIGLYRASWMIAQGTGAGMSLIIGAALNTTTPTSAPGGTTFGVNGVFGATEMPSSSTNYTFNVSPPTFLVATVAATDHITFWFNGGTGTSNIIGWVSSYPGMVQAQALCVEYVGPPFVAR